MAWWATANHQDKDATPHHNPIILSDHLCHVVHVTSFPFVAQRGKNASPQDEGDHYERFHIYWCTFLKMLKEEKVKRHCAVSMFCRVSCRIYIQKLFICCFSYELKGNVFFKYVFIVTLAFCSKPFTVVLQATSTNLMFFDPWQRQVFTVCVFVLTVVVMLFCFILIFPTPLDLLLMTKTTGQSIFL